MYGREFSSLFSSIPWIQKGVPRIIGSVDIEVDATPADRVEFYLDGDLKTNDTSEPYSWAYDSGAEPGLHTIEVRAYYNGAVSKDILDIYGMHFGFYS